MFFFASRKDDSKKHIIVKERDVKSETGRNKRDTIVHASY